MSPAIYAKTYGNSLAVGTLQLNADCTQSLTIFSNMAGSGPHGYVAAAGKNVWGDGLDGKTYACDETSKAAPYAGAEAALILSTDHSLTAEIGFGYVSNKPFSNLKITLLTLALYLE